MKVTSQIKLIITFKERSFAQYHMDIMDGARVCVYVCVEDRE
jgi:hypothetical protein